VRIADIGRVITAHKEREIVTHTDGASSVQIEIFKEGDANIVALAKRIHAAVGEFDPDADEVVAAGGAGRRGPPQAGGLAAQIYREEGARMQVVADRSVFIESSINEVRNTAILGGLLAIFVLYLFLRRVKSTVIVAVSIPMSLLITFAPLNLLGVTLNIMSLGGLALGIGMLVDSSIVVLESIFRCREEGDDVEAAANRGAGEVRGAVWASTLTSIAVFFPMVFVEGLAGQAFGDLGFAVVVSLLASAGVALYFIPMLASRRGIDLTKLSASPGGKRYIPGSISWNAVRRGFKKSRWWMRATIVPFLYWTVRLVLGALFELIGWLIINLFRIVVFVGVRLLAPALAVIGRVLVWLPSKATDYVLRGLNRVYPVVLRAALAHPTVVVLVVLACLWGTWQITATLDSELLPEVHQGEFTVEVLLPVGTPLEETEKVVAPIEQAILTEKEHIRSLLLTVGYDSANSERSDEGEHTARFKVLLDEGSRGAATEEAVTTRLRRRFAGIPDLEARIVRPVLFSAKTPIEVEVHGDDLRMLKEYADKTEAIMASMPELADVETTLQRGAPEVQIIYDRDRLARFGLNIRQVASLVRDKVKGSEATRFNLKDRRIPIVVRLAMDDRETVEDVRGLIVNPGDDRPIRLASVAEVTLGEGPSEVRRIDGRRVAVVSANIAEGSLSAATWKIENRLQREIDWPSSMTSIISGQNAEWERSQRSLLIALALSIFLVYVIMAAQFESLVHPLVIMLAIPLAFVGTVVTLKLIGLSLSIVVFLGMIMLAGIVVNNAIVLVDYINRLRQRGLDREEAIVTAGQVRLRPILMTTATTVLGLTPMALGLGDGAEIRTPMAIAVISGLISSTALTLVVIPSFYLLADRIKQRLLGRESVEGALDAGAAAFAGHDSKTVTT
jgi:HAE1 family hydrophobic/amphiphilic exporter-1